jgi:hypothetical protein
LVQHLRLTEVCAVYVEDELEDDSHIEDQRAPRPGFWAVQLSFQASFEEEHGVALLWHLGRFIGSGTIADGAEADDDYSPTA